MKTTQMGGCGGGYITLGGLGADSAGGGCAGSGVQHPYISHGCVGVGSYWEISGKWEFSNDQNTVLATWGGRAGTNDGFNPE